MALCPSLPSPKYLPLESLRRPHKTSISARAVCPRVLRLGLVPLRRHGFRNRLVFAFAASHKESKPLEIDMEKENSDLKVGAEESQETWKQTLVSFKEQALKMQSLSEEAYELYSKKAMVILKETSEQLKIQTEKARYDLIVIAKEIGGEKSPEPVKDIVEIFASSTDDVEEISNLHDFYLGIPYGILLSFGGFLSFMLTGSISAIRFGVILGAIASILFLREIWLLFKRPSFASCFTSLFSGAMVVFYLYRITLNGGQTNASTLEQN
ncbi:unnamed protein product [Camellia sinensis]